MTKQVDIFELTLPRFKFTHRPIKLFEAFAGIGCQAMALNKLGIEYETVGISEIDKYAITSYNAIHGKAKNYGDICKMTHIPECDIFTWSFPCTDLSKAGRREGLQGGTRSGLVYEVLRLLQVSKPKVLIMENVPDLIQATFVEEFAEIRRELEELGYSNYVERLNAKNYGVAQNRDRVFMVSILGEWYYDFPQKIKLEKRLKDYLEDEVDEKYYLSDKMTKYLTLENDKWTGNNGDSIINKSIASCITTREGNTRADSSTYISNDLPYDYNIKIKEATKQGYALAQDGDEVYINRPHQKRGVVQKGMIQTIKTSGDDIGVVVAGQFQPKDRDYNKSGSRREEQFETRSDEVANAVLTSDRKNMALVNNLRIRKLTPRECWRLMGINDEDFDKASKVVSNSQLYKQAGNGIVVDVFAAILRGLF